MNIHPQKQPIPNTAEAILAQAAEAFKKLSPEEQARQRKALYVSMTGLPYPPEPGAISPKEKNMTHYSSADQLLRPGEVGLFIFTEGDNFTVNTDGSGSTGDWKIDPKRRVDWIFIYRRDPTDTSHNELLMAHSGDLEGPRSDDRYSINLRDIKVVGQTTANWHEFASTGNYPIRYIVRD